MARYFTPDTLRFLAELRENNVKSWFDANKARYETQLKAPALRLIADLGPALAGVSPHFVADTRPNGGSLARIYRDTRFSKDKTPYKTELFFHFGHALGTEAMMPGLFLRVGPGVSSVGGGVWGPAAPALDAIRRAIVARPDEWSAATREGDGGSACGMGDDMLKRVPAGYDAAHPHADDLRRKSHSRHLALPDDAVTGDSLPDAIAAGFHAVSPMLRFLCAATDVAF